MIVQIDPAGNIHLMQGRYAPTPQLDSVNPALSKAEATQILMSRLPEDSTVDELRVVVFSDESGLAFLAYDIQTNQGSFIASRVILDANSGKELRNSPTSYPGG